MTKNAMFNLRDYTTVDILNTPVRRGGILPVTEYPDRTEFDLSSGLTGALMDAFTAPARAARGEISEDQQIPEAFNFAGSLTLGSMLAPRPTGSVGMGGRAAKGALDMSEAAPLRGYHGTNRTIDRFTPSADGNVGPGVYITGSPDEASGYAFRNTGSNVFSPSVLPVEIRGKLASVDDYNAAYDAARDSVGSASEARKLAVETLRKAGFDGIDAPVGNTTNYSMFNPGTVYSATTGDLLFANAKTGAAVPLATKALEAQQPKGIRAFHGSPHDFDRFSMDAIGTGEGAQAYGHGLYFAEAEDVARSYRDVLKNNTRKGSESLRSSAQAIADAVGANGTITTEPIGGGRFGVYEVAEGSMFRRPERRMIGTVDEITHTISGAKKYYAHTNETGALEKLQNQGHMYEVNIKADPQDFLDWDKPLSQQSEKAKEAALTAMERASGITRNDLKEGVTGADAVRYGSIDDAAAMTQALREAGIPGIRYLDQMSRGEGKGSSNYVVFDDALVEILRKYGILPPVAAGGLAAALGQEDELY